MGRRCRPRSACHFVGGLQTNKAGAVARYADVVQSVDRPKLARSLSRGAEAAGRELGCLVQVDFDARVRGPVRRRPADVDALADRDRRGCQACASTAS